MSRIAAVILAGGGGTRLGGVNKALLPFGHERLIDRAVAAAGGCSPMLAAVGRLSFELPAPLVSVRDLDGDYAGPLAGLAAAVAALATSDAEYLLSLAVDTPFFPHDFVARALPLLAHAPAAIGHFGEQDYPTNALWRLDAIRDLPANVRKGTAPHSLRRLAAGLAAARLDYAEPGASDPFRNANTPEDLALLRGIAGLPDAD